MPRKIAGQQPIQLCGEQIWTEDNGLPEETAAGNPLPTLKQYHDQVYPAMLALFKEVIGDEPWVRFHAAYATAVAASWANTEHPLEAIFAIMPEYLENLVDQMMSLESA